MVRKLTALAGVLGLITLVAAPMAANADDHKKPGAKMSGKMSDHKMGHMKPMAHGKMGKMGSHMKGHHKMSGHKMGGKMSGHKMGSKMSGHKMGGKMDSKMKHDKM